MKMGIPGFHRPPEPVSRGEIEALSVDNGMVTFDIHNTGTVHFAPGSVRVRALDHNGASVQEFELPAWYVLAASRRHHDVAQVIVEADFDGTVLTASAPARSACAGMPASN
jgi:hypothetical protein